MADVDEKELALALLKTSAAGALAGAQMSGDPIVSGAAVGVGGILSLVAQIIESHGTENAEAILKRLVDDPATGYTPEEMDATAADLRRQLGL